MSRLDKLYKRQRDMQLLVVHSERARDHTDFSIYVLAMSHIIDTEPSCHGEAAGQQVWKDAMTE